MRKSRIENLESKISEWHTKRALVHLEMVATLILNDWV